VDFQIAGPTGRTKSLNYQEELLEKNAQRIRRKSLFREYAEAAIIAVILALFIRTFVVQAFKIPSGSMEPSLLIGDQILVNKFIYGVKLPYFNKTVIPIKEPSRNDVVVFVYPVDKSKDFIKRVIGLPGDQVQIKGKEIYINGARIENEFGFYSNQNRTSNNLAGEEHFGPVTVPPDSLFVMGDNRDHSYDSRYWGFVPRDLLKGEAFLVYWSWPNWKRTLHLID
jgi:signal peptidase I